MSIEEIDFWRGEKVYLFPTRRGVFVQKNGHLLNTRQPKHRAGCADVASMAAIYGSPRWLITIYNSAMAIKAPTTRWIRRPTPGQPSANVE
jgi:hypothetical protein